MKKALIILIALAFMSCAVNKKTQSMHPYSGDSIGCGSFIIYKLTEDKREYISIALSTSSLDFQATHIFSVGKADILKIIRKKYASDISATLCNDVMIEKPELLLEEAASAGLVEIQLSEENLVKAKNNEAFRVTVILKEVIFEGITIDYLHLQNIYVGWLPG